MSSETPVATLRLPARLTRDEAPAWVRTAEDELQRSPAQAVAVDAAPLEQFDSTALSALLAVRRKASARGLAFAGVQHMPAALQSLAQVYGVGELLTA